MRLCIAVFVTVCAAGAHTGDSVPVFFVANRGLAPSDVQYVAQGPGLNAYFSPQEVLFRSGPVGIGMHFDGANQSPRLEALRPLPGKVNFLVGPEESWRTGDSLFGAVAYRELYPGIDMVYAGGPRTLKSEFIVSPGADPSRIRIRHAGAGKVYLDETGGLVIAAGGHEFREQLPYIYQDRRDARVPVDGGFLLNADGTVSFGVGRYDTAIPLVIDPVVYSTLVGGSGSDTATAMAVDSTGAVYVAGFTASTNLPALNAAQNVSGGSNDVFVAKLNPSGNGLVYCTYLGGHGDDRANGIAIDGSGAVYLTGSTTSAGFPTRLPIQAALAGARNAFVTKLSAAGNSLVFSTYLGGGGSDSGNGIALDAAGNVYITGDSNSVNFPTTTLQRVNHGGMDAFAAKINAGGTQLLYSTYLGGVYDDHAAAIAVNASGEAYITGSTASSDFPVASAWQSHNAGGQDAFVAKLNAAGSALVFSTYLGGTGGVLGYPETGQGIALDSQGKVYVAGSTGSTDFPTLQPLQAARRGPLDGFVAKFDAAGTLLYSTYLGGGGVDSANAITVDSSGTIYVVGQTMSTDLSVTNAVQAVLGGEYDAFLAKLSPSGDSITMLSYLGGGGSDTATSVVAGTGAVYVAGWTLSNNFPVLGAYQSVNSGSYGAFVVKISTGALPAAVSVTPSTASGISQAFSFQFSDSSTAANLTTVSILINSSTSTTSACSVQYVRAANTLALLTDAGATPAGIIAPGSGSQQNSQCTLNGAASTVSIAGNTLTLNLAITFTTAFSGSRTIYMQAANPFGSTGWQSRGAYSVSSGPPSAVSVSPSSGSGSSQAFSFLFTDASGYAAINTASIIINSSLNAINGCYLYYARASNTLYLASDSASSWIAQSVLGATGTMSNSQCSVNASGSNAATSGNNLTLTVSLTFLSAFAGSRNIYMEVTDGLDSGWQQRGSWSASAGTGPPSAASVTPNSGSGTAQIFSFLYTDPRGYAAITTASAIINTSLSGTNGCYLYYARATNTMYLANDAATAWLTPFAFGSSATVSNSQCSISGAGSSVSVAGNNLTLNLALTFQAAFSGSKSVYMQVTDGQDSGWQNRGTWTVSPPNILTAVSATPNSGSGSTQTFNVLYTDPSGYAAISSTSMIVGGSLSVGGVCYLYYARASNIIYLANDAGSAWLAPVTLGTSGTISNSQCTVNASGSSATGSVNNLTVNVSLTFKPAFTGSKKIYMEAYDGTDTGWVQRGTWTVP